MNRRRAYRAEFVAYQGEPEPRMYHLGEAFSTSVAEVQHWAYERALSIAAVLGPGSADGGEVAAFHDWSRRSTEEGTRARLLCGHVVAHAYDGADCTWEFSLRPVPFPASGLGRPAGCAGESE
ncbi:hypothetical protein JGS22_013325 [Streptomyces sp. P38-E01]|uniref:Uncharacterized protein n=1 Tax=Streptomyces tardus TaxID=2780544 RepID=A0A949N610_9ACTN|nr:hypothetical protein [Streptomyces tardus]MBU7598567.1 hypothetical protein [Streptomyces tardus]